MITETEKLQIKVNQLLTDQRVLLENQIRLLLALNRDAETIRIYRDQLISKTQERLEENALGNTGFDIQLEDSE